MIEGGQIDWASHSNDAESAIADTIALDDAVEVAKQFTSIKRDTLIIVTADYETGGMAVSTSPSGLDNEDGHIILKVVVYSILIGLQLVIHLLMCQ